MSPDLEEELDEVRREIKASFAKRRRLQLSLVLPMLFLMFLMEDATDDVVLGIPRGIAVATTITLAVVLIAFTIFNWRCPGCRRYLGRNVNPAFCSKCGVPLK